MQPYVTGSPAWHAVRATHVGSSEVACLFGCQAAYQLSEFALFHVKRGTEAPPVAGERIEWGSRLEQIIAEVAAEREGWSIIKGGYVEDPECPGLGCSLDHVIIEPTAEDAAHGCQGPGILEVKNVDWMIHRASWSEDEPPIHIALQLQQQLACTGYQWGAVVALVGGNHLVVYRFFARPTLIQQIRERTLAFWERVAANDPPPVDGSAGASDVLRSLFPDMIDDAIDMQGNNEFSEACEQFLDAGRARRAANENYDLAKNRIADLIGTHKRAFGSGYSVSIALTPAKPDRPAIAGEVIRGRAEARRLTVKADVA